MSAAICFVLSQSTRLTDKQTDRQMLVGKTACVQCSAVRKVTSSSAIAEKPRCSVGQFWVAITPYSADRPISIKSNQIEIID